MAVENSVVQDRLSAIVQCMDQKAAIWAGIGDIDTEDRGNGPS